MSDTFHIRDLEKKEVVLRERSVDYIQMARNILESYPLSLAHGVQKDAIQNGWDACVRQTPSYVKKNWRFEFELLERPNQPKMLLMSDFGTWGLTGGMTSADITEEEVPPEEERWARWESLAFGKSGEEELGARGQGKMIFLAASHDNLIFYESLRKDGSYRMGGTQATHKGCPVFHFDEEIGRKKIKSFLGLEPITHQGTRVVIVNPVAELVQSIKTGEFITFIEETWWPIIYKLGAAIDVKYNGNVLRAKLPGPFPINKKLKETKTFKIWIKENVEINFERSRYIIKRLCFACGLEQSVPEIHQGIAIFRRGMKVDIVKFPSKILRDKVYGYVEGDDKVDKLLKKLEMPNHYGFRKKGIWRKIEDLIENELEVFGNKKLGLGMDIREREKMRRTSAENRAMSVVRIVTKGWPFARAGKGGGGGSDDGEPPTIKPIGIRISNLNFPNPGNIPRLDYNEILDGFCAKGFNTTEKEIEVIFRAAVLSGDRTVLELDNKRLPLPPRSGILTINKYSFKATKKIFPTPGEYRLRFTLTDAQHKKRLDEITRRFWVETDPELRGPFAVRSLHFSELSRPEIQKLEWVLDFEGDNKYTLYYNLDHPAYQHNDETERFLAKYLSEIFCMGALQLLIKQAKEEKIDEKKAKGFPFDLEKLVSGDPKDMYTELTKAISSIRADVHNLI